MVQIPSEIIGNEHRIKEIITLIFSKTLNFVLKLYPKVLVLLKVGSIENSLSHLKTFSFDKSKLGPMYPYK